MNRIYKSVWCEKTRTFVAISEIARACGKRGDSALTSSPSSAAKALLASIMLAAASSAHALPAGGQIVSGAGAISQSGSTTTVSQATQNLSVNWQSFNVGAQETVNFVQPNASAIAVNRILDVNGSQILGRLNANGQIYLINPNGILFGRNAQVNVGGLVASTLDSLKANGNTVSFSGKGTGSIINEGKIDGHYVALIGNAVSNSGMITANLGAAALGAGSSVTLTFNGNDLVHMQVDKGVLNSLVANGGAIKADGGIVIMTAGAKDELLASVVNNTGVVQAQTVLNRNGTIMLLGGNAAGTVNVGGVLDASAPSGGSGGKIETSAAHARIASDAAITTLAPYGLTGTWLIDPQDYTIAASGGDITGAALSANLGNSNVIIQSISGATAGSGNVNVSDAVSWSANTLTLNAANNININNVMTGSGTAKLALQYGQASAAGGSSAYNVNAPVSLPAGSNFSTQFGSAGTVTNYTVITSLGTQASSNDGSLQGMQGNLAGNYVLGANINASSTSTWNGNAGFTPIGNVTTNFTGALDGLGHIISGLTVNLPGSDNIGLFGVAGLSAIRNVGLTGVNMNGSGFVGGLIGTSAGGIVSNSYTTGSVNGISAVGGLVGANAAAAMVTNSYSSAAASGTDRVGGLVGINAGAVNTSYSSGGVTASIAGGLIGNNTGTVSGSYWDTAVSTQATSAGGTGLTTAQMQTQSSFAGWDFSNAWTMNTGSDPLLKAFLTPAAAATNPSTQTVVNPSTQTVVNPSTQTVVNPSTQTVVNPSAQTVVNPSAQTVVNPSTQTVVNPSAQTAGLPVQNSAITSLEAAIPASLGVQNFLASAPLPVVVSNGMDAKTMLSLMTGPSALPGNTAVPALPASLEEMANRLAAAGSHPNFALPPVPVIPVKIVNNGVNTGKTGPNNSVVQAKPVRAVATTQPAHTSNTPAQQVTQGVVKMQTVTVVQTSTPPANAASNPILSDINHEDPVGTHVMTSPPGGAVQSLLSGNTLTVQATPLTTSVDLHTLYKQNTNSYGGVYASCDDCNKPGFEMRIPNVQHTIMETTDSAGRQVFGIYDLRGNVLAGYIRIDGRMHELPTGTGLANLNTQPVSTAPKAPVTWIIISNWLVGQNL